MPIEAVLHRQRQGDCGLLSPTALRLGGLALLIGSALSLARGVIGILHVLGMWAAVAACFALARRRESLTKQPREGELNNSVEPTPEESRCRTSGCFVGAGDVGSAWHKWHGPDGSGSRLSAHVSALTVTVIVLST